MDVDRFETLLRSMAASPSRRRALGLVGGSLLGGLLTRRSRTMEAKKRKGKGKGKNKNKKSSGGQTAPPPPAIVCTPSCGGKVCGDDGCGGICGVACTSGKTCQNGACQCPGGTVECQGACIPASQCCTTADCAATEGCFAGTCVNLQGTCGETSDRCVNPTATCGGGTCSCLTTMQNQKRCGSTSDLGSNPCTTDAQCAAAHPGIPGVFCIKNYSGLCAPGGVCIAPCAT